MNINWKPLALVSILSSATTIGAYKIWLEPEKATDGREVVLKEVSNQPKPIVRLTSGGNPNFEPLDFTEAAEAATPVVVHIRSTVERKSDGSQPMENEFLRQFFGDEFGFGGRGQQRSEGSGSGVIISPDGYIVTNNHVVEGATTIDVSLYDKSKLKATVIGTDPSTDIAVIKVDAQNLPATTFGNSDDIKVGEWVVAVGNPFNLESTVTAGIVSAKGRSLNIIGSGQGRSNPFENFGNPNNGNANQPQVNDAIESFIQTDAVVNPGNSGGALVNLNGDLIGINTAIASPTGSYAGYAFAVPASIVKKVSTDLIKYGNVQRGYLGVTMSDLGNPELEKEGFKSALRNGAYVRDLVENSAAVAAGIQKGDIITKIDGKAIGSQTDVSQNIGIRRPGEKVQITVNRDGKERDLTATLKNRDGGAGIVKRDESAKAIASLGGQFQNLTDKETSRIRQFKYEGGVKVSAIDEAGKLRYIGVEEGFVITKINGKAVKSVEELQSQLKDKVGKMVQMEGIYLNSPYDSEGVFSFKL